MGCSPGCAGPRRGWDRRGRSGYLLPRPDWRPDLELPRGRHMLAVRASDSSGATQPAAVWDTWNVKGYANNAWHRVPVQAE